MAVKYFQSRSFKGHQGQQKAADLEITDTDREISTKPDGAPDSDKEDQWSPEVSLRVDLAILEQIEDMEEKVARASMQMKQGWKVPSRLSSDPTIKFKAACLMPKKEQDCSNFYYQKGIKHRKKEQYVSMEIGENANLKKGSNVEENSSQEEKMESETTKSITEDKEESCELSENIEKVASSPSINFGDVNPIDIAKERLLLLESAIERRYIKPPLGIVTELNLSSRNSCSSCLPPPTTAEEREEELPRGLLRWRASVQKCQTADQLAMCLNMLEACIAWDKSIMRASCQFCHSGANEEMLLLCDGCDKGYHTYCFKPKMETIPDGDWYCYECLNKATGDKVCVLCGKKGKLIRCDLCPKTYHIDCLDPPLLRPPKGKWTCVSCKVQLKKSNKPKPVSKEKDREKEKETSKEKDREVPPSKKSDSNSSNKSKINEKKEKSKPLINKEFAAARTILDEMELHEDSWPFLLPVDTKQFPTYKKVIKKPMDLSTIRSKLEGGSYKTKDDFSVDVRLIFDNCETFNEDESPVGRAGHNMRAYFDSQWADLNSS
ncbi:bromodomain adjacent to zinc finger domain protein 2B-like [Limulus polyphemus]|uniref:Bromodomain adjacent to zinc finger domain protein 2B-like n=1 Tax=Limulus polyphemus TaxID=6850 RepID=A0ABM1BZ08_LIMPO|nr:bromodomain adjacent to zinc finger domain protein 2B-like [Limulus polyphemus]